MHDELRAKGFNILAGEMGENITTRGIDLLALPVSTQLHLGKDAVIEITGLRNPCAQLNGVQIELMAAVLDKDVQGNLVRKAGVMAVVLVGGDVQPSDPIRVQLPPQPHQRLDRV